MSLKIEKSGIISASGTGINPNLVPNYGKYTKDNQYVWTSSAKDGPKWLNGSVFKVKPNTTYTYSVYCDGILSNTHGGYGKFTVWLYICYTEEKARTSWGYDHAQVFTSNEFNHIQIGQRHIWNYTTTEDENYFSLRVNDYSDGSTPITNRFWCFKVEEGSVATPWIPNENDSNYTSYLNAFVESQSNININASIKKDYVESNRFIEI